MDTALVVRQRKGRLTRLFITCLVFVLIGSFMIHSSSSYDVFFGWVCIIFFGIGVIIFPFQLFRRHPILTINNTEIAGYNRGFFHQRIPLVSVVSAKVGNARFAPYAQIFYDNGKRIRTAYFPLLSTAISVDELYDALQVLNQFE